VTREQRARTLLALVVAAVAVTALGGVAHARRPVCEVDEATSPAAEPRPEVRAEDAAPLDHRVCLPGVVGDAGCWPDDRVPEPGRRSPASFDAAYLLRASQPLSRPAAQPGPGLDEPERELSAGHARRIERPPRRAA
jgi:hypothetical protein